MTIRTAEQIGHLRWLGHYVAYLFREWTRPSTLGYAAVDLCFIALISVIFFFVGDLEHWLPGRVVYAYVVAVIGVSALSTLRYHVKIRLRLARIRRATQRAR